MSYKDTIQQQREFQKTREKKKKKTYYGDGSYTERDFQNFLNNRKVGVTYDNYVNHDMRSEALNRLSNKKPFISMSQEEYDNKFGGQRLSTPSLGTTPIAEDEYYEMSDFSKKVAKSKKRSEKRAETARSLAEKHPMIGTGVAIASDMVGSLAPVQAAFDTVTGRQTNPYKGMFAFADFSEGVRQGIKDGTNIPDDVVDLGLSMGSSAARALTMPTLAGMALAGGSAATSGFRDAKGRGASDLKAKGYGLLQGAIEAATEKFSIEGLKAFQNEPVRGAKSFFKNLGRQMATEGSEEVASEILGNLSDAVIMKEASHYNLYKNSMLAQGYSQDEAEAKAFKEIMKNIGKAAVGGAISGGVLGGGVMSVNTMLLNLEGKKSTLGTDTTYREFAETVDVEPTTYTDAEGNVNTEALEKAERVKEIAEELAVKEESGQKINNLEKGQLELATNDLIYTAMGSEEDYYANMAEDNIEAPMTTETTEEVVKDVVEDVPQPITDFVEDAPQQIINDGFAPVNEGFAPITLESLAEDMVAPVKPIGETIEPIAMPRVDLAMPYGTDIVEAVETFGSKMPPEATETMTQMYDGTVDMGKYIQSFKRVYSSARNNVPMTSASQFINNLNDEQFKAAYKAGAQDRNTEISKAKKIKKTNFKMREGGVGKVSSKATEEQKRVAEAVGYRTGLIINIDDTVGQAEYNPQKGSITISPYSKNFNQSLAHELTHFLQDYAPKEYRKFKDTVISALMSAKGYDYDSAYALYEAAYENVGVEDIEGITDEMVSDAAGMFLNDETFINKIAAKDRTLAEKIRDFFADIVDALKELISTENITNEAKALMENKAKYQMALGLWNNALAEASDNYQYEDTMDDLEIKYQLDMEEPIERTKNLIAIHNITSYNVVKMLEYDGIPMPSIAITKADIGHDNFGEISFVFGSETIDPEFDKRNKVYGADAWTPTFPRIEIEMNAKKVDEIREKLKELSTSLPPTLKEDIRTFNLHLQDEDYLTRHGGVVDLITSLEKNRALQAAFLASKGIKIENHVKTIIEDISKEKKSAYNSVIDEFKDDFDLLNEAPVSKETRERFFNAYREGLIKAGYDANKADALIRKANGFRYRVWVGNISKYKNDSSPKTRIETDFEAIDNEIESNLDTAEYKEWLMRLFDGLEKSKGLWNGKEILTPSGNRKTFKQLHYPLTVENIVKAMLAQSDDVKNDMGFFGSKSIRAVVSEDFNNIEDMHKAEGKLKAISEGEYNKIDSQHNEKINSIMNAIIARSGRNDFMSINYLGNAFIEAARKDISSKNIVKTLNKYKWNISKTEADELSEIFSIIKNAPTKIFEAKPQRVVGYDEIKAALVPEDISSEIVDKMKERGIKNIIEYQTNNEEDRLSKLQNLDNVRFQLDLDMDTTTDTEALVRANRELRETEQYLTAQLSSKSNYMPNRQDINKIAKRLVDETSSWLKPKDVADKLYTFYSYMHNNDYVDGSKVSAIAKDIAGDLLAYSKNEGDNIRIEMFNDLKAYLQKTDIKMPTSEFDSEFASKGGFNEFRKKYFGILKMKKGKGTPVDVAYTELSDKFPDMFPSDIINPADQLIHIGETIDMLRPVGKLNEEFDAISFDEASYLLGQEIIDAYIDVRHIAGKDNTPLAKRAKALNDYKKKFRTQYTEEITRLTKENKALNKALAKQEKENAKTKDYYWERVDKLEQKQKDLKEKNKLEKQAMMNIHKQRMQKLRDNNKAAQYKATIKKDIKDLSNWLLKPNDKKHVPESLRVPLAEFLSSIEFMGSKTRPDGSESNTWREWERLKDVYERIIKNDGKIQDNKSEYYLEVDNDIVNNMKVLRESIEKMGSFAEFSVDQYARLNEIVKAIKKSVTDANTMFANRRYEGLAKLGEATIEDLSKFNNKPTTGIKAIDAADRLINNSMLDSYTRFETFGDAALSVYDELREGLNQKIRYTHEAQEYFENLMEENGITQKTLREWSGEDAKLIEVKLESGETIEMKPSQAMSLYELLKRNQAHKHIFAGGIMVGETKTKGKVLPKVIKSNEAIKVTERDALKIIDELSEEQKALADGIQEFFEKHTTKWGNKTSMQLYGYEKFKAKNYFPIKTSDMYNQSKDTDLSKTAEILRNLGMTKDTDPKASNPLVLEDIFDVFTRQVDQMGSYGSFVVPLSDLQKWKNYKQPEFKSSIKGSIAAKFGDEALTYLDDLARDINGVKENNAMDNPLDMLSLFKSSAVGLNLKVAAQQPTAYFRAFDVMDKKYLVEAATKKAPEGLWETIKQYSPIAQWKDWGYFETNVGKSMKHIVLGTDSKFEKLRENQMWLAGKADQFTWERLWMAAELEIKDTTDLEEGTEAFYKAVGKRFDEIIDTTQVIDSVLHRSNIMKRKDMYSKMATAFMSEPIKAFNMLYRSMNNLLRAKTPEAKTKAKKFAARTMIAYTTAQTINSLINALFRATRDDDKDKDFDEKFVEKFKDEMIDSFNPLKMIPYIKDAVSMIEGYAVKRNDVAGFEELLKLVKDASEDIEKMIEGEELEETPYGIMRKYLAPISSFTGIGIDNLERDVRGIILTALDLTDADKALYNAEKLEKNIKSEKNLTSYMKMAFKAYLEGNDKLGDKIIRDLKKAGISEEKINSKQKSLLKDKKYKGIKGNAKMQYYNELEKAREDGKLTDREVRDITLDMMRGKMSANEAYELYRDRKKNDEKLDMWMSYGNSFDDYLENKNAIEDIREKYSGSENRVERQEAIVDYIDDLNLNEKTQQLLWEIAGYKVSENSYYKYFD